MNTLYPGYDVTRKQNGPSWNDATREVIEQRLALPFTPRFFDQAQWRTLQALSACVLPQPAGRVAAPVAAMVDDKLYKGRGDGFVDTRLPPPREAWQRGLAALDAEAVARHGQGFHALGPEEQCALIAAVANGEVSHPAWGSLPSALLFRARLMHDLATAYYSHPVGWSEIGFGGPASPRGYVRMGFDQRDLWEPVEVKPGVEQKTEEANRRVR